MVSMMMRNLVLSALTATGSRDAFSARISGLANDQRVDLSEDDVSAMADLGGRYVRDTLRLLEAFVTAAGQARAEQIVSPVVQASERFFLQPDPSVPDQAGLLGMICHAYQTRELITRVSEQTRRIRGFPLVASSPHPEREIIRSIVGDVQANALDQIVEERFAEPTVRFACNGAYGLSGSLRATGSASDWGATWEDEARRCGDAAGISFA